MTGRRGIFVAKRTFIIQLDGVQTVIRAHRTYVREGHELLNGREHLFQRVEPHYEVAVLESPTRQPTEPAELIEDDVEEE